MGLIFVSEMASSSPQNFEKIGEVVENVVKVQIFEVKKIMVLIATFWDIYDRGQRVTWHMVIEKK